MDDLLRKPLDLKEREEKEEIALSAVMQEIKNLAGNKPPEWVHNSFDELSRRISGSMSDTLKKELKGLGTHSMW